MIDLELYNKLLHANHFTILDSYVKANSVLNGSNTALCSVSGGSDSDIMLDIIHSIDDSGKVTYYWINTGLEYQATKEHLDELERKYGIEIVRLKPDKSIPTCVKEYGVPFLSKYVLYTVHSIYNEIISMLTAVSGADAAPISDLAIRILTKYKDAYMTSSAAVSMHHNLRGGLLYHSYRMVKAAVRNTLPPILPTVIRPSKRSSFL